MSGTGKLAGGLASFGSKTKKLQAQVKDPVWAVADTLIESWVVQSCDFRWVKFFVQNHIAEKHVPISMPPGPCQNPSFHWSCEPVSAKKTHEVCAMCTSPWDWISILNRISYAKITPTARFEAGIDGLSIGHLSEIHAFLHFRCRHVHHQRHCDIIVLWYVNWISHEHSYLTWYFAKIAVSRQRRFISSLPKIRVR